MQYLLFEIVMFSITTWLYLYFGDQFIDPHSATTL